MQPIDPTKVSAKISSSDTEVHKEISNKHDSAIADKQRLAIGLLLKQTLRQISEQGMLSVDTQKALITAKKIFPGEFTQLYIQDRVQQHKNIDGLKLQLNPQPLTMETVRQWLPGQLLQTIVYQPGQNGQASLLVNGAGYFDSRLLEPITIQAATAQAPANSGKASAQLLNPASDNAIKQLFSTELMKQAQLVKINTELPLQTGQFLLIQVHKNAGELSFQLHHHPRESHLVSSYLNQFSSKQQALPQLMASLKDIVIQGNQTSNYFTSGFKQQVAIILQQLPSLSNLTTADNIKAGLQNSGQFMEHKILHSAMDKTLTTNDLKAALSQLLAMIKNNDAIVLPKQLSSQSYLYSTYAQDVLANSPAKSGLIFDLPGRVFHAQVQPPVLDSSLFQLNNQLLLQARILDQLEGVLSRIMFTQLQSREGGEQQMLNFEIPFRHNDQLEVLQLKIREQLQQKEAEKGNKIWTVNLAFHLPSLGGIRIYITMDQQDLSMQFWTEEKDSQKLLQHYFYLLQERLQQAGFTISQLRAFHGLPESAEKEQKSSQFIIDEQV